MKATYAFMGLTFAAKIAAVAEWFSEYSGTLAGLAACVTIAAGVRSFFRKDK